MVRSKRTLSTSRIPTAVDLSGGGSRKTVIGIVAVMYADRCQEEEGTFSFAISSCRRVALSMF